MSKIKDIYAGKPDAKDEVETVGIDPFIENYVMPDDFNKDALISGTSYFITGYKGTGKTALLYYLNSYIRNLDEQTCSSFIFFKGDYSDLKKQEMELLSRQLFSAISISENVVLDGRDFEYIWRWLLYCRIIEDNQQYNYGLYEYDQTWKLFEEKLSQIEYKKKRHFLSIPQKVHLECKTVELSTGMTVCPSADIDFSRLKVQDSDGYRMFVRIIDEADELFEKISISNRSNIPYFLFIDELEAYYGDKEVFMRDLNLIRDLIFTVKKLNQIMGRNHNVKTKMICSVRSEILNSINRFVISKELNKITSGYETPLKWDYKNTNSFQHPILKILIKRIKYAEGEKYTSDKALIDKWFPEKINGIDAANYILNNSWCKPRDIVRLILSAQNCMAAENESFSQSTIDMCKKKYSQDSMDEIKEEMRALYSAEQIDLIIGCLTGFKRKFSYQEIRNRVEKYYEDTFLKERLFTILNDLYRLGIIGNFMNGSYRWQHKGDDRIILDDVWMIIIHPALLTALSVNSKQDRAIGRKNPKQGEKVRVLINRVYNRYAFGTFESGSKKHRAFLHISKIANEYVCDLNDYIEKGKKYEATLLRYDEEHDSWHIIVKN